MKRSSQYRRIHDRLSSIHPVDQWQDGGVGFAVFDLSLDHLPQSAGSVIGALGLFAVRLDETGLTAAQIITPQVCGTEAAVEDLLTGEHRTIPWQGG